MSILQPILMFFINKIEQIHIFITLNESILLSNMLYESFLVLVGSFKLDLKTLINSFKNDIFFNETELLFHNLKLFASYELFYIGQVQLERYGVVCSKCLCI